MSQTRPRGSGCGLRVFWIVAAIRAGVASVAATAAIASGSVDAALPASSVGAAPSERVEARSSDLYAVGVVQGDRMNVRLSRIADNAPVTNAVLTVRVRGAAHATVAEADGSYTLQASDLGLPGPAAVEFLVTLGETREQLSGTLDGGAPAPADEPKGGGSRQIGWWVLNFAVCLGFLWLWSRRKPPADG